MLLMSLMSRKETEEAIELLKEKVIVSKKNYGLSDSRTKELERQLTLYMNHHKKLETHPHDTTIRNL